MGSKAGQSRRKRGGGAILRPQFKAKEITMDREALEAKRAMYQQELQNARANVVQYQNVALRLEGALLMIDELLQDAPKPEAKSEPAPDAAKPEPA